MLPPPAHPVRHGLALALAVLRIAPCTSRPTRLPVIYTGGSRHFSAHALISSISRNTLRSRAYLYGDGGSLNCVQAVRYRQGEHVGGMIALAALCCVPIYALTIITVISRLAINAAGAAHAGRYRHRCVSALTSHAAGLVILAGIALTYPGFTKSTPEIDSITGHDSPDIAALSKLAAPCVFLMTFLVSERTQKAAVTHGKRAIRRMRVMLRGGCLVAHCSGLLFLRWPESVGVTRQGDRR